MNTPEHSEEVLVYTDGSSKGGQCGFALLIFHPGSHAPVVEFGNLGPKKNRQIAGEVEPVVRALAWALDNHIKKVTIHPDYNGIIGWTEGLSGKVWQANDDDAKRLVEWYTLASDVMEVNFIHVRGHQDDQINNLADILAGEATLLPMEEDIGSPY